MVQHRSALSEPLDRPTYSHIDVRDLALFHVLALSTEKAGGERFIVTAGIYSWQEWINAADGIDEEGHMPPVLDASKSGKVFGVRYRTVKETATDMVDGFRAKGW